MRTEGAARVTVREVMAATGLCHDGATALLRALQRAGLASVVDRRPTKGRPEPVWAAPEVVTLKLVTRVDA